MNDDIHALSGAYAVDAVDDVERARFEQHLVVCAECAAEVASLREAAQALSLLGATTPPERLRGQVLRDITAVRPLPPEVRRGVVRSGWVPRLVAAAAAAVLLIGGAVAFRPWDRQSQGQLTVADRVLAAPDAQRTSKTFPGGATATVVRSTSVGRAVIVTSRMPAAPSGKVYQLWLQDPSGSMVPAGLMPDRSDQTVLLEGDAARATAAGITVEPPGGSAAPTSEPIALFSFT